MGLTAIELAVVWTAGLLIGTSKAGLKGVNVIVVALLVHVYDAKIQTGILLPLLIVGDVLAVIYYRRHTKWSYLARFLPAMVIGVIIAGAIGDRLGADAFKTWLGIIVLISVAIMLWRELKTVQEFPQGMWFAGGLGVAAGFASMIGNLAGAFANMFFLATRLPKNEIIGTSAWLFFIINLIKVPIHIWSWETINMDSLQSSLLIMPSLFLGFWLGMRVVGLFSEQFYRYFLFAATAIGAIMIVI